MNKCVVTYSGIDMECCGSPFSIGSKIKWYVCKANDVKPMIKLAKIDYRYDVHGQYSKELFVLEGDVTRIKAIGGVVTNKKSIEKNIFKRLFKRDKTLFDIKSSEDVGEEKFAYTYFVWIENYKIEPLK